jgi:TPR repeat protein
VRRFSLFQPGKIYRDGLGMKADGNMALFWLSNAADRGHPEAIDAVARLYAGRLGIPTNCIVSLQFSVRAAEHGSAPQCIASVLVTPKVEAWLRTRSSLEMVRPGLQSSYRLRQR